jgi:hypothetical protein
LTAFAVFAADDGVNDVNGHLGRNGRRSANLLANGTRQNFAKTRTRSLRRRNGKSVTCAGAEGREMRRAARLGWHLDVEQEFLSEGKDWRAGCRRVGDADAVLLQRKGETDNEQRHARAFGLQRETSQYLYNSGLEQALEVGGSDSRSVVAVAGKTYLSAIEQQEVKKRSNTRALRPFTITTSTWVVNAKERKAAT